MTYPNLKHVSLILLALFLWVIPLRGQKIPIRDFQDLVEFAGLQSSEKQIWDLQAIQEEKLTRESTSELLPKLRAYGNWDNYLQLPVQLLPSEAVGGEPGTFTEIRFGTQYQINLGIEASMPLVNLELWNRIKADQLKFELSLEGLNAQEQAWKEQLARSYFLLLLHRESLVLAQNRYTLSDSIYQLASAKFEIGEMEPLPFHRIKASALASKNQVFTQEKQIQSAFNLLRRLVGSDSELELEFLDQLEPLGPDGLNLDYPLETLPEWKQAQHRVKLNQQLLKQTRSTYFPTLSATGRFYQQTLGNQFNLKDASSFEVGVVGLSLEWKLFQGGKQKLKSKTASLDYQIAQKQLEVTTQSLLQEKLDLEAEIRQNQALLEGFKPLLLLYESNYRLAGIQWIEGLISADELLQVEAEWVAQQLDYLLVVSELSTSKALISIRNHSSSNKP